MNTHFQSGGAQSATSLCHTVCRPRLSPRPRLRAPSSADRWLWSPFHGSRYRDVFPDTPWKKDTAGASCWFSMRARRDLVFRKHPIQKCSLLVPPNPHSTRSVTAPGQLAAAESCCNTGNTWYGRPAMAAQHAATKEGASEPGPACALLQGHEEIT